MHIKTFPCGPYATNTYVVACPQTKNACVVDPAVDSFSIVSRYLTENQLQPFWVLLTHSHWDHIAEVSEFHKHYSIPVALHREDAYNLEAPGADLLPYRVQITPVKPERLLEEGDEIFVGQLRFRVIHTPGHTPGGICFYCEQEGVLLSGDTLFRGSIGNLSLPTGQPARMRDSLLKLALLPKETRVYPGHGPETTIGAEPWLARPI